MKKSGKIVIVTILALIAVAGGAIFLSSSKKSGTVKKAQNYDFATVSRGVIESTVSATGTLSVVSSVSVLAQMSGRIENVEVDYNQRVRKGQVLATINTDLLKLQAKVAQAAVDKAEANYDLQLLATQNAEALSAKGLLSDYDLKTSQSTLKVNKADLSSAQASLEQIETEINQYAIITSPIDGIVLARNVDPGASVTGGSVSSSTSLFTLAGSLTQMEIEAEVDELDISSIKVGQEVRFTVEANPGETFQGKVKEIRLVPETSDNLVYYYVIILAENKSGKLLPGMTASVTFIKQKKDDILTVPSAALRFTPTSLSAAEKSKVLFLANLPSGMSQEERDKAIAQYDARVKAQADAKKSGGASQTNGISSIIGGMRAGPGGPGGPFGGPTGGRPSQGQGAGQAQGAQAQAAVRKPLWYLDESGKLAAAMVQVGISDATKTELLGPDSVEGKKVILKVKAE